MIDKHSEFLWRVQEYVKANPEIAARVTEATNHGLSSALSELQEKACDMETLALICIERKFKGRDELVKSKLMKWKDRLCFVWPQLSEDK